MIRLLESNDSSTLLRYDVSHMDVFKVIGLHKDYSKNIRAVQRGNYESYKIIGTQDEISPILQYCKSKGVTPRKRDVSSADRAWYASQDLRESKQKPWNDKYKGFSIRLNNSAECYDVYDKYGELEDTGFRSIEDAKKGIDGILSVTEAVLKPSEFLRRDAIEYLKNPMITARWSDNYAQEVIDYIEEVGKDSLVVNESESSHSLLKLSKSVERDDGSTVNLYRIHDYDVSEHVYPDGTRLVHVTVHNTMNKYVPAIYVNDDLDGTVKGFEVQTTSYGSLPLEEINEYCSKLQAAAEIAELLTREFVK